MIYGIAISIFVLFFKPRTEKYIADLIWTDMFCELCGGTNDIEALSSRIKECASDAEAFSLEAFLTGLIWLLFPSTASPYSDFILIPCALFIVLEVFQNATKQACQIAHELLLVAKKDMVRTQS